MMIKTNYYIATRAGQQFDVREVSGRAEIVTSGLDKYFIGYHKAGSTTWAATELRSGLALCFEPTLKAAKEKALEMINRGAVKSAMEDETYYKQRDKFIEWLLEHNKQDSDIPQVIEMLVRKESKNENR